MTDFPRARIERIERINDARRFKLLVHADKFFTNTSGALCVLLDRADVANLQLDCSNTLLDDDIETGVVDVEKLAG